MKITKELIDEALDFYRIDDPDYVRLCHECVDEIKDDEKALSHVKALCDVIFTHDALEERAKYGAMTRDEIFPGIKSPYIFNIAFFSGIHMHKENIKKLGFDDYQIEKHRFRPHNTLTIHPEGALFATVRWASLYVRGDIIEIGSLQFERDEHVFGKDIKYPNLHVHIPAKVDFSPEAVSRSLKDGREASDRYYGKEYHDRYCESWLLDPYLKTVLPETSNIISFQNRFDVYDIKRDGKEDVLNFLFKAKPDCDLNALPEDTSLRRKMKAALLRGDRLSLGKGKLIEE